MPSPTRSKKLSRYNSSLLLSKLQNTFTKSPLSLTPILNKTKRTNKIQTFIRRKKRKHISANSRKKRYNNVLDINKLRLSPLDLGRLISNNSVLRNVKRK